MTRLIAAAVLLAALFAAPTAAGASSPPTWPHPAGRYPVVYVENHASNSRWHVLHAVREWHFAGARFRPCVVGVACVRVYGRDQGTDHGFLATDYPYADRGSLSYVRVVLNRHYAATDTAGQLHQAAVVEVAHALGLRSTIPRSCLQYRDYGRYPYAGVKPRRAMASLYGVDE